MNATPLPVMQRARRPEQDVLPPRGDADLEHRARRERDQDLRDRDAGSRTPPGRGSAATMITAARCRRGSRSFGRRTGYGRARGSSGTGRRGPWRRERPSRVILGSRARKLQPRDPGAWQFTDRPSKADGPPRRGRLVQRLERARLRDGVLAPEQQRRPRRGSRRSGSRARGGTSRPAPARSARVPSSRRSSITGLWQCHGSSRKSEPSLPIASSSSRSTSAVPQSKSARTSPGKRIVAVNTQSVPVSPNQALRGDALRLAGEQARAADAVAADVHQRAALDVGAQADVLRVVEARS